jgi:hypothetical protein
VKSSKSAGNELPGKLNAIFIAFYQHLYMILDISDFHHARVTSVEDGV